MVELAAVLPVVMFLGFGAIEYGNLIYRDHLLWNGVRDGARYYAGRKYDSANAAQISSTETDAKNITVNGALSGGTARVPGWTTAQVSITYSTVANTSTCGSGGADQCYRGPSNITMVTVSTTYPYSSVGFMSFLGLGAINLTASHQERIIGIR